MLNDAGKAGEALAVLERMFDAAEFDDARTAGILRECRELHLRLSAQVADADHDRLWRTVLDYRDEVARMTGFPVDLVEDNGVDDATATSAPAWRRNDGKHVVRYNSRGKAVVSHIVALELGSLRMEHEAREAGRACDLRYMSECPERERAIEEHARQLARGDVGEAEARAFVARVTDTLMPRLLLSPLHAVLEHRLWTRLPEIRPSQTVGLYLHGRQKRNPLDQPQVSRAIPACVRQAHETAGAAWAIFVDRLCDRRTAHAADYARCPGLPLARELADGWQKAVSDFHAGDEYDLVRQFVRALGVGAWLEVRQLQDKHGKQGDPP